MLHARMAKSSVASMPPWPWPAPAGALLKPFPPMAMAPPTFRGAGVQALTPAGALSACTRAPQRPAQPVSVVVQEGERRPAASWKEAEGGWVSSEPAPAPGAAAATRALHTASGASPELAAELRQLRAELQQERVLSQALEDKLVEECRMLKAETQAAKEQRQQLECMTKEASTTLFAGEGDRDVNRDSLVSSRRISSVELQLSPNTLDSSFDGDAPGSRGENSLFRTMQQLSTPNFHSCPSPPAEPAGQMPGAPSQPGASTLTQLLDGRDPELAAMEKDVHAALASRLEVQVRALQIQVDCMSCELHAVRSRAVEMQTSSPRQDGKAATDQLLQSVQGLELELEAAANEVTSARGDVTSARAATAKAAPQPSQPCS